MAPVCISKLCDIGIVGFTLPYWWMAEHTCKEDIYVQHSILENAALGEGSISVVKEKNNSKRFG